MIFIDTYTYYTYTYTYIYIWIYIYTHNRYMLQKRARSPAAPMRTRTSQIVAGQLGMGENDEFVQVLIHIYI